MPVGLRENTASSWLGSDCFQLSIAALSRIEGPPVTCSVGSREEVGSVGRELSHRPGISCFRFGNGEGKITLLFGCVGR